MTDINPDEMKAPELVKQLEDAPAEVKEQVAAQERQGKNRKSVLEAAGVDPEARTDSSGRQLNAWEVAPADQAGGHPNLDEERDES